MWKQMQEQLEIEIAKVGKESKQQNETQKTNPELVSDEKLIEAVTDKLA